MSHIATSRLNVQSLFPIKVEYGHGTSFVNVTIQALSKGLTFDRLKISSSDQARNDIFGDPFFGTVKCIAITNVEGHKQVYQIGQPIDCEIEEKKNAFMRAMHDVQWVHSRLTLPFGGGTWNDTFVFQTICALFVPRQSPILEIGAGIGRTSLVMQSLLPIETLFVSLECNPDMFIVLTKNAEKNGLPLQVQNIALSHVPLMQHVANRTTCIIPAEGMLPHKYELVQKTQTFSELEYQYHCSFSSIIFDCGGTAPLQLLQDDAEHILKHATCVVVVNEMSPGHKLQFDSIMVEHGMYCVFQHSGPQNPMNNFEVWYSSFQKQQESNSVVLHSS